MVIPRIAALLTELGYPASAADVEDRLAHLEGSDGVLITGWRRLGQASRTAPASAAS